MPTPTFSLTDIQFLLSRVNGTYTLPELNGAAPFGPTGIRNVQGLGNNTADMTKPGFWFGAGDTLFPRLTFNRLTDPLKKNDLISGPFANTQRGYKTDAQGNLVLVDGKPVLNKVVIGNTATVNGQTVDALNPRNISNLIADSTNSIGFTKQNADFKLLDDPTGRVSPTSGAINPLAYSNWMSQFGQFFDHGLDFVAKGIDGKFEVSLMPGDSIRTNTGSTSMSGSRNNTVNVTIGDGSSDDLLQKLGILKVGTPQSGDIVSWKVTTSLTKPSVDNGAFFFEGTLVLNNTLIKIQATDEVDLAAQINLWTPTTGVVATLSSFPAIDNVSEPGAYILNLTPARAESFNQTSPFVDLSQNYGSDTSRTVFLREYIDQTASTTSVTDVTTGRLLNAGATTGDLVGNSGMADWALVKANAAKIGIILHDADIMAIPQIAFDSYGHMILDADGMPQLVALNRVTGDLVYVKDTTLADDAAIQALVLKNGGSAADYVLLTTKHAFLNDMGIGLPGMGDTAGWTGRDLTTNYQSTPPNPYIPNGFNLQAALEEHLVSGDGRLNENIGLTAVHEVFLNEHNRVLDLLKAQYGIGADPAVNPDALPADQPPGGWLWKDPLTGQVSVVTGESLFQQAKLVVEMEYQHMVFAEFARKLSPNIPAFAGVNPAVNADIPAEFAHAVYRLGHSMLPESIGMKQFTTAQSMNYAANSSNLTVNMVNHGLTVGTKVQLSGIDAPIGGVAAAALNGKVFTISAVSQDGNSFTISTIENVGLNTEVVITSTTGGSTNATLPDGVQIEVVKGLFDAFLNPGFYDPGATAKWLASGSSAQVGMAIDEKTTDALRDNLLRQGLDLPTLNLMRGRDAGMPTLNEMRASLQAVAPLLLQPTLNPYTSWTTFRDNLKGVTIDDQNVTVKNFMMAYAADAILTKWGSQVTLPNTITRPTDLAGWYALRESANSADRDAYMNALKEATNLAFADATFMGSGPSGNKDFNRIDAWIGGLAEKEVIGGMLGSTFDTVFAMTMLNLQNGDLFYYLGRVPTTEFFNESIDGSLLSDLVSRSTGAKYLYGDIFSTADKTVMMDDVAVSAPGARFNSFNALQGATTVVDGFDALGNPIKVSVGRAGYVGNVFYGNPGDYLDARGEKSPNGIGNASETIVGTTGNDEIHGLGGNDTIWGEGGNDTIFGEAGVDFIHGGDGDDTLDGGADNDFMYGEAGNDTMRGDIGIDTMFGGDGNDTMYGGAEGDLMVGGTGNDVMYGGDGVVDPLAVTDQVIIGGVLTNIFIRGLIDPETVVAVALIDDVIHGGQNDDVLYGGGGWDNLTGESGHDVLSPGTGGAAQGGREVMNGGEGDDIYVIESDIDFAFMDINDTGLTQAQRGTNIDTYRQGRGIGVDEVRFTQNVAGTIIIGQTNNLGVASIFTGIERVVLDDGTAGGGTAAIDIDAILAVPGVNVGLEIVGNAGVNNIIGTIFDDKINGGAGADIMDGGNGNDTYYVDDGNDQITEVAGGGGGTDTVIVTTNANFILNDNLENLTLQGTNNGQTGTGNNLANVIIGSAARNTINGLGGADTLYGGAENDTMNGGDGDDTMYGELNLLPTDPNFAITGNDTMNGGNGNDTMFGENGNDTMNGDAGNDTMDGGAGNDTVNGGAGTDIVKGGAGADTINGGTEVDSLWGGAGADTFRFSGTSALSNDIGNNANDALLEVINDFEQGTDRIDVTRMDGNGAAAGTPQFVLYSDFVAGRTAQMRFVNGVLEGDFNGDQVADWRLKVNSMAQALAAQQQNAPNNVPGITQLTAADFVTVETVSITAVPPASAAEGTGTNTTRTFKVQLSGPISAPVTFDWAITGGTANATDFVGARSGTAVTISNVAPTGETLPTAFITVTVAGDALVEADETFNVVISNLNIGNNEVGTVILGTTSAAGSITNDDVLNVITRNSNNNAISGANDTINGTANADQIDGLGGADTIRGGDGNDVLMGNTGNDNISGGNGNDNIDGGAGNDTLNGDAGDDLIYGGAGLDTMTGGAGVDTFRFTNIAEIVNTRVGNVVTARETINSFVTGTDKIDLTGVDGNADQGGVQALTWVNTFTAAGQVRFANGLLEFNTTGTTGADFALRINGGTVAQGDIIGLAGVAPAVAPAAAGPVPAPAAVDPVPVNPAPVDPVPAPAPVPLTLNGGATADTLVGGEADDVLNGNGGNDTLIGNGGADRLNGGAGFDNMDGGAGADLFVFNAAIREIGTSTSAHDVILNFESGVDKIDLSAIDANASFLAFGNQAFTWIGDAAFTAAGQIRFDAATGLLEGNVNANRAADFAIEIRGGVVSVTDVIL